MPSVDMTEGEFRELFKAVSSWGRWDDDGERGALNHLTPTRTAAAARLVRSGTTVTLSQPLKTVARIDVPAPADHHMTCLYGGKSDKSVTSEGAGAGSIEVLKDGLVGRGVLLDVPRLRGVPFIEPGDHVFREDLVRHCEEAGRWDFLFATAPLRIARGTGSPLNPTAIF